MSGNNSYRVFSGTATRYLAEKICLSLDCPLGQLQITKFSDGEFAVSYEESIRGRDVFLVQSTFPNSDNLMELLLMIDAAKRASARTINAVIPYFGWARQDRKDKPRVSIGAKLVADLLSVAGVNRVITMDLHADQIQGFFDVPVDHLYAKVQRVKGIGAKTAQRIVLELADKMGVVGSQHLSVGGQQASQARDEAMTALTMLGFAKPAVEKLLMSQDWKNADGTPMTVEEIIKEGLKRL